MDKSENYIEMCKVEEIQKLYESVFKSVVDSQNCFEYFTDDYVWIPRQDELIKIINSKSKNGLSLLLMVCLECDYSEKIEYFAKFDSVEQLLLAHIMWFQYKKEWNGIEWS